MSIKYLLTAAAMLIPATSAIAGETITYMYDAKGRLIQAQHSGSLNSALLAKYTFDAADNRTSIRINGSPFAADLQSVIVVPLNGLTPIIMPSPGL